jgi:hypothetical protein
MYPIGRRRNPRTPFQEMVRLSWEDSGGHLCMVRGKAINRSMSGLMLETTDPIETRIFVQVQVERYGLVGMACVRHCGTHTSQSRIFRRGCRPTCGRGVARCRSSNNKGTPSLSDSSNSHFRKLQCSRRHGRNLGPSKTVSPISGTGYVTSKSVSASFEVT